MSTEPKTRGKVLVSEVVLGDGEPYEIRVTGPAESPKPPAKVTDARLTECLAQGGGECPFCGDTDPECLSSEKQDDCFIEVWACRKRDGKWREIYDLVSVAVATDDAAEGETGCSKPVVPPMEIHELVYKDGKLDIKASHPVLMLLTEECSRLFLACKSENFLTLTMHHESIGHFSVVIQKLDGLTPNEKLLAQDKIIADLRAAAKKLADAAHHAAEMLYDHPATLYGGADAAERVNVVSVELRAAIAACEGTQK